MEECWAVKSGESADGFHTMTRYESLRLWDVR